MQYINAHGTSTKKNDLFETIAYKATFGEHASKLAISSIKGSTGHSLGAAGAFEAVACVKAIETGTIPPTINYETPDPECDLNYTPNKPAKMDLRVALSDNLGFGGHNGVGQCCCLLLPAAACCLLPAACCLLPAACCLLPAAAASLSLRFVRPSPSH